MVVRPTTTANTSPANARVAAAVANSATPRNPTSGAAQHAAHAAVAPPTKCRVPAHILGTTGKGA